MFSLASRVPRLYKGRRARAVEAAGANDFLNEAGKFPLHAVCWGRYPIPAA
jgi:hypothetical protein